MVETGVIDAIEYADGGESNEKVVLELAAALDLIEKLRMYSSRSNIVSLTCC